MLRTMSLYRASIGHLMRASQGSDESQVIDIDLVTLVQRRSLARWSHRRSRRPGRIALSRQ